MITTAGRQVILNYFGGLTGRIGGAIALGAGNALGSASNTKLDYEVARVQISSVTPDFANNRIVFKSSVNPGQISKISEIGLFQNQVSINRSKIMSLIGNARSTWTNATLTAGYGRVNTQTAMVTAAASSTTVGSTSGLWHDYSGFLSTDGIAMTAFIGANVASVKLRIGSDASNYFEFSFAYPAAGYMVLRTNLANGKATGTPDWSAISYVAIVVTASSAGSGSVYFDSVSLEDNTSTVDNILVVRNVLTTPAVTDLSVATDIELSLGINV